MRITRRQIRRIIREEYYSKLRSDDPLMSEGLLDFLGSVRQDLILGPEGRCGGSGRHVLSIR